MPSEANVIFNSMLESLLTPQNVLVAVLSVLIVMIYRQRETLATSVNISAGLKGDYQKGAESAKKPGGWPEYTLLSEERISSDSKRLLFQVPPNGVKKLDVGRHIMCRATINGERVVRPYSPTVFAGSTLELVVKAYEQAKMSKFLHGMSVGDSIEMFGPVGSLKYSPSTFQHLIFICAGTGVTPVISSASSNIFFLKFLLVFCDQVYAMAKSVLSNSEDSNTKVLICYQNRGVADILLHQELSQISNGAENGRCQLVLACSRAGPEFSQVSNSVTQVTTTCTMNSPMLENVKQSHDTDGRLFG